MSFLSQRAIHVAIGIIKFLANLFLYTVLPVPIPCETGIWANPINGHRMQRDGETNTFVEYTGAQLSHKVNKRTLRPI